jgi:membrane-associated phospholipid phosphatase
MATIAKWKSSCILSITLLSACADGSKDPLQPSYAQPFTNQLSSLAWQERARGLAAANNMSPLAAARVYALLSVAQYAAIVDAVPHEDVANTPSGNGLGSGGRDVYELERGAVAGASATVLSFVFPAGATEFETRLASEGAAGPGNTHPAFQRGVAVGRAAGQMMVDWARADRFTAPWTGVVPTGPGYWIANGPPAGAQLPNMQPYYLTSAAQFRPVDPPAYASPAFMTALNEIVNLSLNRTPQQLALALAWNYGAFTPTPPGYWNMVAGDLIREAQLDERDATHITALAASAVMDALIACWECKYHAWVIRPSQAATALGLPPITLPLGLPNHPSYPSGHSCGSAAGAAVLAHYFPQHAADLASQVTDAGLSRMYGGIHYRFDVEAGQTLGRAVAANAIAYDQANGLLDAVR